MASCDEPGGCGATAAALVANTPHRWRCILAGDSVAMDMVLLGPESGRAATPMSEDVIVEALGLLTGSWAARACPGSSPSPLLTLLVALFALVAPVAVYARLRAPEAGRAAERVLPVVRLGRLREAVALPWSALRTSRKG